MTRAATTHRTTQPLLLLVALVGALLAVPAAPAGADTCDGVWVVVDASELGGGTRTRCAAGDPGSGLQALEMAGFSYTFVPRHPGMVCTIDGRPDPCNGAPSDAHWSYWTASPGGDWQYSSKGAGNRDPAPGTVDGWSFGDGDPPGTPPPADTGGDEPRDDAGGGTSDGDDADDATSSGSGSSGGSSAASSGSSKDSSSGAGGSTSGSGDDGGSEDGDGTASTGPDQGPADATPAETPTSEPAEPSETETPAPTASATTDEETEDLDDAASPTEASTVDVASVDDTGRSAGNGLLGLVAGGALVAAVAGAAVLRARRRPDAGSAS